jgi:hypothetical protein
MNHQNQLEQMANEAMFTTDCTGEAADASREVHGEHQSRRLLLILYELTRKYVDALSSEAWTEHGSKGDLVG